MNGHTKTPTHERSQTAVLSWQHLIFVKLYISYQICAKCTFNMHFDRVEEVDNLLEMNDTSVTMLRSMYTKYLLCTCEKTENEPINEAVCSKKHNIICDDIPTKTYQKNTCHSNRRRRSLQGRISYIPNNFVQHQNRIKASLEINR